MNATNGNLDFARTSYAHIFHSAEPAKAWHVLWTRPNFEKIVYEQLKAKGYDVFLPQITEWSRRADARRVRQSPMFKGYLFLHGAVDKFAYLDVCSTDGLVSILGDRWDRLAHIPDHDIKCLRTAVIQRIPTIPYPFMESGEQVRVVKGPLINAEGFLVRSEPTKGLFIVSLNILRRSIAVELDYSCVAAA